MRLVLDPIGALPAEQRARLREEIRVDVMIRTGAPAAAAIVTRQLESASEIPVAP